VTFFGSQAHGNYQQPQDTYNQAQPSYQTTFNSAAPAPNQYSSVQDVYEPAVGKPGNFPAFNTLPGFAGQTFREPSNYEAQASIHTPAKAAPPSINTFGAYDVPLKVEETYEQDEQDVYFIFYEDKAADQQQQQV
jgi:hypothetical protein